MLQLDWSHVCSSSFTFRCVGIVPVRWVCKHFLYFSFSSNEQNTSKQTGCTGSADLFKLITPDHHQPIRFQNWCCVPVQEQTGKFLLPARKRKPNKPLDFFWNFLMLKQTAVREQDQRHYNQSSIYTNLLTYILLSSVQLVSQLLCQEIDILNAWSP